ncbi:MAG: hypothetical protein KAQ99_05485, partial [Candidatus Aureabacteria bacterium]|nr:hypothetical protein [Candidatus Auribacterota bacterium]
MSKNTVIFFTAMLTLTFSLQVFAAPVYLEITKKAGEKIKVAVPGTQKTDEGKLAKIVASDLELSGYVTLVDEEFSNDTYANDRVLGEINFSEWSRAGTEILLTLDSKVK